MKDREYIRKNRNKNLHLKSRLLGYIAGDGNILVSGKGKCTHNTLRFYPDNESLITPYEEATKTIYNKKSKIKKEKNYYSLTIDSKPLIEDITSICDLGTYDWKIPDFVLKETANRIEWIKAFFDAEAYVHNKYIRVQSVNSQGLNQIKYILQNLEIHSRIYEYTPANKKHQKVFMLTIYRNESKKRYLDLIGFNHTIKLKKLKATLQNIAVIA